MRNEVKRQRPGAIVLDDYISITAAAANDAWEIPITKPDGDLAEKYMLYVTNLCTESDFDINVLNNVTFDGISGFSLIETNHVENSNFTLLSKTAWNSCFKDKGSSLTDYSAEAESAATNDVVFDFSAENDALYFGASTKFRSLLRAAGTAGVYDAEFVWEYYDGDSWEELENVESVSSTGAGNPAHPFVTTGAAFIKWDVPEDWVKIDPTGNPVEMYWIRARVDSFTSITTAPRISRLWQSPAYQFNSFGYPVDNLFNGDDARLVISNEAQITLPTRVYVQIKEI